MGALIPDGQADRTRGRPLWYYGAKTHRSQHKVSQRVSETPPTWRTASDCNRKEAAAERNAGAASSTRAMRVDYVLLGTVMRLRQALSQPTAKAIHKALVAEEIPT